MGIIRLDIDEWFVDWILYRNGISFSETQSPTSISLTAECIVDQRALSRSGDNPEKRSKELGGGCRRLPRLDPCLITIHLSPSLRLYISLSLFKEERGRRLEKEQNGRRGGCTRSCGTGIVDACSKKRGRRGKCLNRDPIPLVLLWWKFS